MASTAEFHGQDLVLTFHQPAGTGAAAFLVEYKCATGTITHKIDQSAYQSEDAAQARHYQDTLTHAENQSAGLTRDPTVTLYAIDALGNQSPPTIVALQNSIPVLPQAPTITPTLTGVTVSCQAPLDTDNIGFAAWVDTKSTVAMDAGHNRYQGSSNSFDIPLADDQVYYIRVAPYDAFGLDTNSAWEAIQIQRGTLANNGTIASLLVDVDDLKTTYGSTSAAAASAADAAASADASAQAASTIQTAQTNINTAVTNAQTAVTQADQAVASIGNAVTEANTAAQITFPSTFDNVVPAFTAVPRTSFANGQANPLPASGFVSDGTYGTDYQLPAVSSGQIELGTIGLLPYVIGKLYKVSTSYGFVSAPSGYSHDDNGPAMAVLDANYNFLTLIYPNANVVFASDALDTYSAVFGCGASGGDINITTAKAAYLRPLIHCGVGSRTFSTAPVWRFKTLAVTDVTAQQQAQVYAGQASTSATNAQGYSSTASTQAGVATTQAKNASTNATSASGSAQTATNQATAAGTSASAASASATAASTSAGQASTSASQASTSASNAQGYSNSAATSASTAATTATTALLTAALTFPSDMGAGAPWTPSSTGSPASLASSVFPASIYTTVSGIGSVLDTGAVTYATVVNAVSTFTPIANRVYDFEALVRCTKASSVSGSVQNTYVQALYLDANYQGTGGAGPMALVTGYGAPSLTTGTVQGWTVLKGRWTATGTLPAFVRPRMVFNDPGSGTQGNAEWQLSYFKVQDVTDQVNAANSASAAATSASNASASQTAAGQSASSAATQATNAGTQAGNAQTYAGQASTSATNAQGFANTASGAANTATAQAGVSSSSSLTAQQAMALNFPSTMVPGAPFFNGDTTAPSNAVSVLYPASSYSTDSTVGSVFNSPSGFFTVGSVATITPVVGRTYDLEVKARILTANTNSAATSAVGQVQFVSLNSSYAESGLYTADAVSGYVTGMNTGAVYDWTVFKCRYTATSANLTPFVRPRFYGNYNNGSGGQSNAIYQISYFKVSDVTEMVAAAGSAGAALSYANASSASANAANTSAQTASTQATNAGNSASTASGYAGQASTSASNANTSQSQAAGYASNSQASANSASGSATSAQTFSNNASASAGTATNQANAASGSATSASNSAAAASSSATLSASVGTSAINANPFFTIWPTDGQPPTYWSWWDASFGTSRAAGIQGRPYSAYFNITNTSNNGGFVQAQNAAFGSFVIELTGRATSWQAAGLLVYFLDTNSSIVESCVLHAATTPDSSNYTSSDGGNGAYTRTFSKFYKTNINGAIQRVQIYAMASWDGFGAAKVTKQVWFDKVSVRPATQPEIDAGTALSNANSALSQITSEASTRAAADAAITTTTNTITAQVTPSPNLITNPTAQNGNTGWVGNITFNVSQGGAGEGYYWQYGGPSSSGAAYYGQYQDVSVAAGQAYSLQGMLFSGGMTGSGAAARLYMEFLDGNRSHQGYSNGGGVPQLGAGSGWTLIKDQNEVTPSGCAFIRVHIDFGAPGNWTNNNVAFRRLKLEQNSICTVYSDDATVGTINASVTQQSGAIATLNGKNQAYWQLIAAAGGATAAVAVQADGVAGNSTIDLVATSIALSTTANGSSGYTRVLTVDGGGVHVYGNLASTGAVSAANIVDNSLTQKVILSNGQSYSGNGTPSSGGGTAGGGGGAGNNSCVDVASYLPNGNLAGDTLRGDELFLLNREDDEGYHAEPVERIRFGTERCARIHTASGITLVASLSTPITLKGGEVIDIRDSVGREVPVLDAGEFRWEAIVELEMLGERRVALISAGDGTYAASEHNDGRFIFTHNTTVKP